MSRRLATGVLLAMTLVLVLAAAPVNASPGRGDVIHVVKVGETLSSIARQYGVSPDAIARANGITNPNLIYVGQRLVIPSGQSGGRVHVVRAGETLIGIAWRYGVDAWAIARANNITNLNRIYVGQRLLIPGAVPAQPSGQPSGAPAVTTWPGPWAAQYFDNATLSGTPFGTRTDQSINFNWGAGPALGGMPVNHFSVRWTGTFNLDGGSYRFYAKVDDGVRVFIDGTQVINGWRAGALRTYSALRSLGAGQHTIVVEYYEATGAAQVYFWYVKVSGPAPTATPSAPADAWYAEFFNNKTLEGAPAVTRYDGAIGFDWGGKSPDPGIWWDGFSARWTRTIELKTDHYRFCTMADDGSRIWVDNQLVLDHWHANNGVAYCGTYWASTGKHTVRVEYYEDGGQALIYMWWEPH
jgi:LysM repeat protein